MQYWLVKSEPDVYSFDQLTEDGTTMWEGVRNYQARNFIRAMEAGDLVLYYHSRTGLEVVGLAMVEKSHYPDPTAVKGDWSVMDLKPVKKLNKSVSLKEIKAEPKLRELLLTKNGRLSVMPVSDAEFRKIMKMGETRLAL